MSLGSYDIQKKDERIACGFEDVNAAVQVAEISDAHILLATIRTGETIDLAQYLEATGFDPSVTNEKIVAVQSDGTVVDIYDDSADDGTASVYGDAVYSNDEAREQNIYLVLVGGSAGSLTAGAADVRLTVGRLIAT